MRQTDSANIREFFRYRINFRNLWPLEPGSTTTAYYLVLDFMRVREIAKSYY